MFDVLADVLEQVRLAGTVYFSAEFRAPWGVSIRPEGRAPFYVVTAGGCLLEVDGEPAPRTLAAGDSPCCRGRMLTFFAPARRHPPSRSVGS
jgi:hypothetical protein